MPDDVSIVKTAGGTVVGGLGGRAAGMAAGAALGSVVPIVGTAIGGMVGGAIGGMAGAKAGDSITDKVHAENEGSREKNRLQTEAAQESANSAKESAEIATGEPMNLAWRLLKEGRASMSPTIYNNPVTTTKPLQSGCDICRGKLLTEPCKKCNAPASPLGGTSHDIVTTGEPMGIVMRLLKERVSPEAIAHKLAYDKKYESTPERVKYREDLNRERRQRHIMGHGGPDMSHTKDHTIVPEDPHTNRARHFKEMGTLL